MPRPRIHENNAARQRAYRTRQKERRRTRAVRIPQGGITERALAANQQLEDMGFHGGKR